MAQVENHTPVLIRDDVFATAKQHCRSLTEHPRVELMEFCSSAVAYAVDNPQISDRILQRVLQTRLETLQTRLSKPKT
jgi:hypothetical protein